MWRQQTVTKRPRPQRARATVMKTSTTHLSRSWLRSALGAVLRLNLLPLATLPPPATWGLEQHSSRPHRQPCPGNSVTFLPSLADPHRLSTSPTLSQPSLPVFHPNRRRELARLFPSLALLAVPLRRLQRCLSRFLIRRSTLRPLCLLPPLSRPPLLHTLTFLDPNSSRFQVRPAPTVSNMREDLIVRTASEPGAKPPNTRTPTRPTSRRTYVRRSTKTRSTRFTNRSGRLLLAR